MLQEIINYLSQYITAENIGLAAAWVAGTGVVAIIVQGGKHYLVDDARTTEGKKRIRRMVWFTSFLMAVAQFLIFLPSVNPALLGIYTSAIVGASGFIFQKVLSPLYAYLLKLQGDIQSVRASKTETTPQEFAA